MVDERHCLLFAGLSGEKSSRVIQDTPSCVQHAKNALQYYEEIERKGCNNNVRG